MRAVGCRAARRRTMTSRKMASEYDFPSPYSRRLRRTLVFLFVLGAVLAGAASTALIVAVPLQPRSNSDLIFSNPVAGPSPDGVQSVAKADANTPSDVRAARVAEKAPLPTREADATVATIAILPSSGNIRLSKSALSHLKLDESAPAASDLMPRSSRLQPLTDTPVTFQAATWRRGGAARGEARRKPFETRKTDDRCRSNARQHHPGTTAGAPGTVLNSGILLLTGIAVNGGWLRATARWPRY